MSNLDDYPECDFYDGAPFEDPPLYRPGKLAGMSLDELRKEHDRQCDRQGALGDAEYINERAVEETEMRCRLVEAEIQRRLPGARLND